MDKEKVPPFIQPVNAERLVKFYMPELELSANQPRRLEMREAPTQPWNTYLIEKFGVDGRVQIILEGGAAQTRRWVDLSQMEYRWLA